MRSILRSLLLLILTVAAWARPAQASPGPQILVAVSIAPLADFVRRVGCNRVEVITLVPSGASPHTYELKPSQVVEISRARLLVLNGVGLEYWADKLVKGTNNPALRTVDTSDGISLISAGAAGANPHIWLDVRQAMIQVAHVRDALIATDPARRESYEADAERFLGELERLDREVAAEVEGWAHRQFIAFHPAWVYFARRYGLRQVGVIEESPGREPSPAHIVGLIETAKRISARAIFAEPQLSSKAAQAIAEESGVRVVLLDPLGSSLQDPSYVALMRYNVARMGEALR